MNYTPKQIKKAKKIAKVLDEGNVAIVEHILELEDTLEEKVTELETKIPNLGTILDTIRGKDGETGQAGEVGPKGDKGEPGEAGKDGVNGRDGINGKDGRDGLDGRDGEKGDKGEPGKDGVDGKDAILKEELIKPILEPHINAINSKINAVIAGMPRGSNYGGFIETQLKDSSTGLPLKKDASGAWLVEATGGTDSGTGDVVGPNGSDNGEVAFFDNTTGKLIAGDPVFTWDKTNVQLDIGGQDLAVKGNGDYPLLVSGNSSNDISISVRNLDTGNSSFTDVSVSADNDGSGLVGHYIDMGIAGSGFSAASSGNILTESVGAGGLNYVEGDVLTLTGAGDGNATVTVISVDGSGTILALDIAINGSGYSVQSGVTTSDGTGTGATVNILSLYDNSLIGPGSGYIYTSGGDMVVLTDNASKVIKFAIGGFGDINEKMRLASNGYLGVGTKAPTNIISLGNTQAQKIWIENTTNTTVGRALTISAGSTVTGGTADVVGGNLILTSGAGKGTGASSILFQTGRTLATGSTLQTLTTVMTITGAGNVGIGSTPTDRFEISNGSSGTFSITSGSGISVNAGTSGGKFYFTPTGNLGLGTAIADIAGNYDFTGGNSGMAAMGTDYKLLNFDGYVQNPFFSAGDYVNYLIQSESFNTAAWTKTAIGTITADNSYSPNGTLTAEQVPAGSDATGALSQAITEGTTGYWTFSIYLKAQSGTANITLLCSSSGTGGGEAGTAKTITLTTTWKRYFVTQNYTAAHTIKTVKITSGTTAICAWGAQFAPYATLSVYGRPTVSTAVTASSKEFAIPSNVAVRMGGVLLSTSSTFSGVNGFTATGNNSVTLSPAAAAVPVSAYTANAQNAATAVSPIMQSPSSRWQGQSWTTAAKIIAVDLSLMPNSDGTTGTGNLIFQTTTVNGVATSTILGAFNTGGGFGVGIENPVGANAKIEAADTTSVGSELVTNGGFASDTTGWTLSNSTLASVAGGQSGNCLQVTNNGTFQGYAYQTITTVVGTRYYLTYYFQKGTNAGGYVKVGSSVGGAEYYQSGQMTDASWAMRSFDFVATSTSTTITCQNSATTTAQTSLFDTISFKAITGGNIAARGKFTGGGTAGLAVSYAGEATSDGALTFTAAAKGIVLKQGSNGKCGTFTANGVTPVTVSNTSIAITDIIMISLNTVGGTVGVQPHVATITASTGFTVVCTALDTSTYNYAIISNAA